MTLVNKSDRLGRAFRSYLRERSDQAATGARIFIHAQDAKRKGSFLPEIPCLWVLPAGPVSPADPPGNCCCLFSKKFIHYRDYRSMARPWLRLFTVIDGGVGEKHESVAILQCLSRTLQKRSALLFGRKCLADNLPLTLIFDKMEIVGERHRAGETGFLNRNAGHFADNINRCNLTFVRGTCFCH